ncbi:Flagellar biosynthesis protein FliO [hydrothermal vent metagenome]|uniref:Flagellar biosynthesis protein FliO n=1 Tax=hydrothermal vent metagenome TaxID=652676 RepID=A0A3B0ZER2_9ZZZZ
MFNGVNAAEETKIMVAEQAISSADSIDSLLQVSIGLAIVLAAIFALAWFVKRVVKVNTAIGGAFKVISILSVGQREKVVLVQLGERQMVLGVAPGSVRLLQILDEPIEAPSLDKEPPSGSFADRLQATLNQRFSS